MTKRLKILTSAFFVFLALTITAKKTLAFEGTAKLTGNTDATCVVTSVFLPNGKHKMVVSCVNLIYPPATDRFAYVLWGDAVTGRSPLKLGALESGKAEFTFGPTLTRLFVTVEPNDGIRSPSSNVVMSGRPNPLDLTPTQPGQTPLQQPQASPTQDEGPAESFGEILEEEPLIATATQDQGNGIVSLLRKGGIILAVVIFVVLLLLAFLTRARG